MRKPRQFRHPLRARRSAEGNARIFHGRLVRVSGDCRRSQLGPRGTSPAPPRGLLVRMRALVAPHGANACRQVASGIGSGTVHRSPDKGTTPAGGGEEPEFSPRILDAKANSFQHDGLSVLPYVASICAAMCDFRNAEY